MQSAIPLLLFFFFYSSSTIVWYKDRLNWTIAPCFGVKGVDIHPPYPIPTNFKLGFRVTDRLRDSKSNNHRPFPLPLLRFTIEGSHNPDDPGFIQHIKKVL